MAANLITLVRILMAFSVILMFHGNFLWCVTAAVLTLVVIYLDSLDGIIARKLGIASEFGALFDITGDRIVEHLYWIFFATVGLVSLWVPIIFLSRSFLVDTLRAVAFSKAGKTPFGEKSMMRAGVTHFLTASRFSRGIYGVGKVIAFILLGSVLALSKAPQNALALLPAALPALLATITNVLVWIVVAMNLIRGIPVLIDGRGYLLENQTPKTVKNENLGSV